MTSTRGRFRSLFLKNLLSFGSQGTHLELGPLNVLIGPNASGKSNLLEAVGLLQAAPKDLPRPTNRDGVSEWLWKGSKEHQEAAVEAVIERPGNAVALRHRLEFTERAGRFAVTDENIEALEDEAISNPLYQFGRGRPVLTAVVEDAEGRVTTMRGMRPLPLDTLKPDQSILSQRRDPERYPELAYLADLYDEIRLYTEWNFGRRASQREPESADTPGGYLEEDGSNLAMVLSEARNHLELFDEVSRRLKEFYERIEEVYTAPSGGKIQVYIRERMLQRPIPATRLSDGTLRFLCLLVILCHPNPPPVVGIEEPELGIHPDLLPTVAELLVSASARCQLIVTTHSDLLVSQFTERPESVVVCDRGPDGTYFRRLGEGSLGEPELALGDQWLKGQIGGTRW